MNKYLKLAESSDDNQILRDSYSLWSGGLSPDYHRQFRRVQKQHPWGRQHLRYFVWQKSRDRAILSSCKLYDFTLQHHNHAYRIAGIGAVFTAPEKRGQGHAADMIMAVCDLARQEAYDAVMLNSDIDWRYYAQFGFIPFEALSFALDSADHGFSANLSRLRWLLNEQSCPVQEEPLSRNLVPHLARHYRRWQKNKTLSFYRSESYWDFKIMKELFLQENALPQVPGIQVLSIEMEKFDGAYALFECGQNSLRVLEVTGSANNSLILWQELIRIAESRNFTLIRGWEGAACSALKFRKYERNWSRPMLLPCNSATRNWLDMEPWPLLELDHY